MKTPLLRLDSVLVRWTLERFRARRTSAGLAALAGIVPAAQAQLFPAEWSTTNLNGATGYTIVGGTNDLCSAVAGVADFDGDSIADILIGSPDSTNGGGRAAAFLVRGTVNPAARFDIPTLNGTNGFALYGETNSDNGLSLSAGDFNGDGFSDLIVSGADIPTNGGAYVVFGAPGSQPNPFDMLSLNGTNGFRLRQVSSFLPKGYAGVSIASGFDMNGDGFDEVAVGDPLDGVASGRVFVRFGSSNVQPASIPMVNSNGAAFIGSGFYSGIGFGVENAGDVNGDGYDDLFTRGIFTIPQISSVVGHVVFGSPDPLPNPLYLSGLSGDDGFTLNSAKTNKVYSGIAIDLSAAGDFNGDGYSDVAVAIGGPEEPEGGVAIVYGRASFAASVDMDSLSGTDGIRILGTTNTVLAPSALAAGDFNGDGADDLVIGALNSTNGSVVLFGGTLPTSVDSLDGDNGFRIFGGPYSATLGRAAAAGDVNGDGIADIILQDDNGSQSASDTHVIFGRATAPLTLLALEPENGASNIDPNANLHIDFSRSMTPVSGDILIRTANGTTVESIPVTQSSRVRIRGRRVIIDPLNSLLPSTDYNIQIAPGAFRAGVSGAAFGGFSTPTNWSFSTRETRSSTATVLYSMPNPSIQGQPVELSATVVSFAGLPSGTIEFFDGTNQLGSAGLAAGLGQLTVSNLLVGTRSISARFMGNPALAPSVGTLPGGQQVIAGSATTGGGTTSGAATAGTTGAGGSTGGTIGTTGAGGTTGGFTSGGGTASVGTTAGMLARLPWQVIIKKPKVDKKIKFKQGKQGIGTVIGSVTETELEKGFVGVRVQLAIVSSSVSNAGTVRWDEGKVKKVNKKGNAKFSAKKFGAASSLVSGQAFELWARASTNFGVASSDTNRTPLTAK